MGDNIKLPPGCPKKKRTTIKVVRNEPNYRSPTPNV